MQLLSKVIYAVKIVIYGGTVICSKHITQLIILQNTLMKQNFAHIYLILKNTELDGTFHCSQRVVKTIFKYESWCVSEELGC